MATWIDAETDSTDSLCDGDFLIKIKMQSTHTRDDEADDEAGGCWQRWWPERDRENHDNNKN